MTKHLGFASNLAAHLLGGLGPQLLARDAHLLQQGRHLPHVGAAVVGHILLAPLVDVDLAHLRRKGCELLNQKGINKMYYEFFCLCLAYF